jgi:hypothetical protein
VATFVINEWLPEDSSGVNGRRRQSDALTVITRIAASDHQIVIIERSPVDQKFWNLCKNNTDFVVRGIARAYVLELRFNLSRCITIRADAASPIPEALAAATKTDDHYLLSAQCSVPGAILVTSDEPLLAAVTEAGLPCLSRSEFLKTYC